MNEAGRREPPGRRRPETKSSSGHCFNRTNDSVERKTLRSTTKIQFSYYNSLVEGPNSKTQHPHVSQDENICNNSPIITGTRTPVRSIVAYHKNGLTAEEIAAKLHYLSLSEIYDALAFYYDNKDFIDKDIEENSDEEYWKSQLEKNAH